MTCVGGTWGHEDYFSNRKLEPKQDHNPAPTAVGPSSKRLGRASGRVRCRGPALGARSRTAGRPRCSQRGHSAPDLLSQGPPGWIPYGHVLVPLRPQRRTRREQGTGRDRHPGYGGRRLSRLYGGCSRVVQVPGHLPGCPEPAGARWAAATCQDRSGALGAGRGAGLNPLLWTPGLSWLPRDGRGDP